jgi:hypothetical protein
MRFAPHVAVLTSVLWAVSCRDVQNGSRQTHPDASNVHLSCSTTADCNGHGICMNGVCEAVKSCMKDSDCAPMMEVCHSSRFYCVQCDGTHPNECPQGQTCQFDFTCVMIGVGNPDGGPVMNGDAAMMTCGSTCMDRTSCTRDEVCTNGHCCTPPPRCFSDTDCPASRPSCSTMTGECIGGATCNMDTDCDGQSGCAPGACMCSMMTCVTKPDQCASDTDCRVGGAYVGKFCTVQNPPRRCVTSPSCTTDNDCTQAGSGLQCDLRMGSDSINHCVNGTPCPMGNECNTMQTCVNHVCVAKNCVNTPNLCPAGQHCDQASAMCLPNTGGMCMQDTDCMTGYYCNTFMTPSLCEAGCRSNADCMGGVCDASHTCQTGMGGVCGPCMTDAQCPAGTHCLSGLGLCYQPCAAGMTCTLRPGAMCVLGNCTCFL